MSHAAVVRVRLDRPPPRLTDWMLKPTGRLRAADASERTAREYLMDLRDLPLGLRSGACTWQVSKSGRYIAPELPCPYTTPAHNAHATPARRRKPPPAESGGSASSGASNSSRSTGRSRSVPPQAHGRRPQPQQLHFHSPLAAACRAYASARLPHHAASAKARQSAVLASMLAADALRLEESLAQYYLELQDEIQSSEAVWARITVAANEVGLDVETYARLLALQHREIEPEDYEVLTALADQTTPARTLRQAQLDGFASAHIGARGELVPADGVALECLPAGAAAAGFARGETCTVCLEDFAAGEQVRVLPCRHWFHLKCIDDWLTGARVTCPVDGMAVAVDAAGAAGAEASEPDAAESSPAAERGEA